MSKSIGYKPLICQCLSLLPTEEYDCPLQNYRKTLTTSSLIKLFVAAQLDQWSSYAHMEEKLRAHPALQKELGIPSISGSQMSRRINELPTEIVQRVFGKIIQEIRSLTKDNQGISKEIGRLNIVDSTEIRLPENLCDWSFVSNGHNAVKMHTRLVVVSKDVAFPDKIVPSTGKVSDFESSDFLIEADDATYVMDRGYPSKKNLMDWLDKGVSFVVRITKNLVLYTLKKNAPTHEAVLRDEIVNFGISNEPIRYIEFVDEKRRIYRLLTTRFDLTDQEILEIYKNRWAIELFFKWIKGHLKFTKIWSTKPKGIWNQMFLALIALGVSLIWKLKLQAKKTTWQFFRLLRTYLYFPRKHLIRELTRPLRKSNGRQKIPIPKEKKKVDYGNVALVKEKR